MNHPLPWTCDLSPPLVRIYFVLDAHDEIVCTLTNHDAAARLVTSVNRYAQAYPQFEKENV